MSRRVVWKFPVSVQAFAVLGTQIINIPEGARLLHCAAQGNAIGLWYEIPDETSKVTEQHGFQVFGTGHGPINDHLVYVGTALFDNGNLVLHVYEVVYP